jgi:uncharacterized protein YuzE
MSHYAREDDIAAIELEGFGGQTAVGEDHDWGLVLRDRESGRTLGFEIWQASQRLPAELLAALPEPTVDEVVDGGGGTLPHAEKTPPQRGFRERAREDSNL